MTPRRIRPLAICVFRHEGRILAAEGRDEIKRQTFYRPLGGGIEPGERSSETIARELREEIGAEVKDLRSLGTLENIFTYNGEAGHEIVLVYDGALADEALYRAEVIVGREDGVDAPLFTARWMPIEAFRGEGAPPLYPTGLLELLEAYA